MWITVISCIFIIVWSVLLWEAWNTPITPNNFEEDDLDIEKQQLKNDYHDVACCDDEKICECGMKGKSMFSKKTTNKKQKLKNKNKNEKY